MPVIPPTGHVHTPDVDLAYWVYGEPQTSMTPVFAVNGGPGPLPHLHGPERRLAAHLRASAGHLLRPARRRRLTTHQSRRLAINGHPGRRSRRHPRTSSLQQDRSLRRLLRRSPRHRLRRRAPRACPQTHHLRRAALLGRPSFIFSRRSSPTGWRLQRSRCTCLQSFTRRAGTTRPPIDHFRMLFYAQKSSTTISPTLHDIGFSPQTAHAVDRPSPISISHLLCRSSTSLCWSSPVAST